MDAFGNLVNLIVKEYSKWQVLAQLSGRALYCRVLNVKVFASEACRYLSPV